MRKTIFLIFVTMICCLGITAQVPATGSSVVHVRGTVLSETDHEPVIGATVIVTGTKTSTVTNIEGDFDIDVPKGHKITISYVGMEPQTLLPKAKMTIMLSESKEMLEDVVVTGMTKMDRRMFTGATDQIKADDAILNGVADVSRSLEGRAAGVSVQNVSGTFGAAPKIHVRGATSIFGDSKPLWVVDGVIVEDVTNVSTDDLSSGDANTLISSAIAGLNSDDIESFQVLKDGSATSIYGARAMAGVIVITTKKGKAGQASISYTGEFTSRLIPSYNNYNILNSQDQMGIYQELKDKGWLTSSTVLNGSEYGVYGKMYELINTYNTATGRFGLENTQEAQNAYLQQAEARNTNWFDQLFSSGIMQNHSVSMSGGTEKSTYYGSMSAMIDPGWYIDSKINRYTAKFNMTQKLTERFSVSINGTASYRQQKAPGTLSQNIDPVNGEVSRSFDINPFSYALNTSRALDPTEYYTSNYASFNIFNELENNYIDINVVDTKFQADLKYKPIKDLEIGVLGAMQYNASTQEYNVTENSNQAEAYRAMKNTEVRDANQLLYSDPDDLYSQPITVLPNGGFYKKTDNRMLNYAFRATANYSHAFKDKHFVNVYLGMEINGTKRTSTYFNGVGMQYTQGEVPFYTYEFFKKAVEENTDYYSLENTTDRSTAFFGNATYSFKHRYTLNGTLRYEGTNMMGMSTRARWLPTWNLSGSWNLHEEEWFEEAKDVFSNLTLRASYSLTGDRPPRYINNSTVILNAYTPYRINSGDKETGIAISNLENSELTYEKKHELNLGFEAGMFHNFLNISFDIYWRNNYDLIGQIATQGVGGQVMRYANIASMSGKGQELSITANWIRPAKPTGFAWQTSFIYAHNTTNVTELNTNYTTINYITGTGFTKEGYPARGLFSYQYVGLDENGYPLLINNDGAITSTDFNFQSRDTGNLVYEGPTDPTVTGSIGNTFRYHNFTANVFVTYSAGNVIRLDPVFSAQYNDMSSMTKEFNDRWMVPGDEAYTNVPVILSYRELASNYALRYGYNAYNYSTERIAKGDFVRMKELSLQYDFPTQWFGQKKLLKKLSLKLQATNLFLIYSDSKLNGQDPEFFRSGGVSAPMAKQFTLTLKAGF